MSSWALRYALLLALCLSGAVFAQNAPKLGASRELGIDQWLTRVHAASRGRAYVGTFVVTSGTEMSSSRIVHACDGQRQVERVEALNGPARLTFRRDAEVVTFLPQSRLVVQEVRASLGMFPDVLKQADASVARYYQLKTGGVDRVAGLNADKVQLLPLDALRFGYKIWTEQRTGLVLKLQILDAHQRVLEQAAFSELQLDVPVRMAELITQMDNRTGYSVHTPAVEVTTSSQEGWRLKPLPGFRQISCHRRGASRLNALTGPTVQCVFSDGLASVSLFMEPYDAKRHRAPHQGEALAQGATHMVTGQRGAWWLTAIGEVPVRTLELLMQGLERQK